MLTIDKTLRPIMKWAGGKTQMLKYLLPIIPNYSGKYIEPFFGGGALFFALQPTNAVIADVNPELINMYAQVANNIDTVIKKLSLFKNTEEMFYSERAQNWKNLPASDAAARTLYLNKTCFNGLYRVNRNGQFNTPYGRYKNPTICDEILLRNASNVLRRAEIVCGDYLTVLKKYAEPGDFIFLDPPYIPVSQYADFKRYTKEQFSENDHKKLAEEVKRLYSIGCYVILTNSDHPLVYSLYSDFNIQVVNTKRSISSKSNSRKGKDIIVTAFPSSQWSVI